MKRVIAITTIAAAMLLSGTAPATCEGLIPPFTNATTHLGCPWRTNPDSERTEDLCPSNQNQKQVLSDLQIIHTLNGKVILARCTGTVKLDDGPVYKFARTAKVDERR